MNSSITIFFISRHKDVEFVIPGSKRMSSSTTCLYQGTYNAPSGCLIIRAIKMTDSSNNMWYLQKVDQTMLDEYTQDETNNTGKPLYWANYDGGDGSEQKCWGGTRVLSS